MKRKDGRPKGDYPSDAEAEERLAACAELMLTRTDYQAASEMMRRYDIGRRAATDWVAKVRRQWAADAKPAEGKIRATRGEHRARLLALLEVALNGRKADPDDPDADLDDMGETVCRGNIKVAADLAMRLAQLDGHLTSKGPPIEEQKHTGDAISVAVAAVVLQVEQAIKAHPGGVQGLIDAEPTMPDEVDRNPRAAVRARDARIAELEAQLAAAGVK